MKKSLIHILLIIVLLAGCKSKEVDNKRQGLDFHAMAHMIMDRAQIKPGERVVLMMRPGRFDSLVNILKEHITESGAVYLGTISADTLQPSDWATEYTNQLKNKSDTSLMKILSSVDLGIMLPGAKPDQKEYAALQAVLRNGKGRTIHFHWEGAYSLDHQLLEVTPAIDSIYQYVLLNTDYTSLAARQKEFESAIGNDSWVTVTTPAGTNLTFQVGNRPVTKQDGNASLVRMDNARNLIDREIELPAGAIRVAPIEETVSGTIAFPNANWNSQPATGVVLTFQKGKVIDVVASSNKESVLTELKAGGDAANAFREFALGFNPLLQIPTDQPWIPYYGYGAGVVRLSLGDNSELGGNVMGNYVRWNFFPNATVKVNGDVWVDNGKLIR